MLFSVQEIVRQELSNIITFVILAIVVGIAVYNGSKAIEGWLLENENRHARSHAIIHTLHNDALRKIEQVQDDLEDEIEELHDEITDMYKQQADDTDSVASQTEIISEA